MNMEPYRRVLALRGVPLLLVVGFLARIPVTAVSLTLTLHVVHGLGLGFTQAGLVGMVATLGTSVGAPLAGRFIDRHGLRPVLVVTTAAQLVFWLCGPALPYSALLVAAGVAGLLSQPVFTLIRQCLAAMVPEADRRTAFALDSMGVELSYMVGPAVASVGVTALGSGRMMALVACGLTAAGAVLFKLNPPTRSTEELAAGQTSVPRRRWLPGMIVLLCATFAVPFVLTATELAIVATLTESGALSWTGAVIGLWCLCSMIGGFVYGGLSRGVSPLWLAAGLCITTVPLGLVGGGWWWLCLALIPSGLLCAPSLSSTVEEASRRAPGAVRGEAMGLHATALTLGVAAGSPFAGAIIDAHGAAWTYAATGTAGIVVVLAVLPFWRKGARSADARDAAEKAALQDDVEKAAT